jgi:hypothetical protein
MLVGHKKKKRKNIEGTKGKKERGERRNFYALHKEKYLV